jgi:hypothetical protein
MRAPAAGHAGTEEHPPLQLTVNDKKLSAPLRVRLKLGGQAPMQDG